MNPEHIQPSPAQETWDLLIIGGGITGAGVFREAVKTGARVRLVEQRDFASGTSSWSSKLVHGGLRYLKNGQWRLTREAVRERERLLREAPGLVDRLGFALPNYAGVPGNGHPLVLRFGLWLYDRLAGRRSARWYNDPSSLVDHLRGDACRGLAYYEDARTDDARLTLRLIQEGIRDGGVAQHYTRALRLLVEHGQVCGAELEDADGKRETVRARVVVNAAGPWSGQLDDALDVPGLPRLRPLRGSHLVFPGDRWPLSMAVSWMHPDDGRPVFAIPWEGCVVFGTTDLDHTGPVDDPRMTSGEAEYLAAALRFAFPDLGLDVGDAVACYSGIRPVVAGEGMLSPSEESRESANWHAPGLVGITGGKLTTFRVTAREVLRIAATMHPALAPSGDEHLFYDRYDSEALPEARRLRRLAGRYGRRAAERIHAVEKADDPLLAATPYSLAELEWCAVHEPVRHLDDLLLRRVRLGLLCPRGGQEWLDRLQPCLQPALGWHDARWRDECTRYAALWERQHDPGRPV